MYNEKNTILQILKKIDSVHLDIEREIVIVDDCSVDGTRDILNCLDKNKYKIIFKEKNEGKGAALRTGFAEAVGDVIIVQDADLEYDPEDYKIMLEKMREQGVEVVYGSRRLHRNYFQERHSGHIFALGGIFLTWLTNILYGIHISDEPTCYKMFKIILLEDLHLACNRFEFCPEFTAKIAKKGIKIHEVPINYNPRHKAEGKKINWKDAVEAVWTLVKYKFYG